MLARPSIRILPRTGCLCRIVVDGGTGVGLSKRLSYKITMSSRPLFLCVLGLNFLGFFGLLQTSAQAQAPATFEVGSITFSRPSDWSWVTPSSSMRKAQLAIPGINPSAAAEVTFFHFGAGGGGDTDSNVKRWLAQFKSAPGAEKVEEKKIGSRKVTVVSTEGVFSSGMPGAPVSAQENYALLGAIMEDAGGTVFIKVTGPKATVQAATPKFFEFLAAAKP